MWQLKVRQQVFGDIQHGAFDLLVKHIEFRSGFVTGHVLQCCREHAVQTIWHTHTQTHMRHHEEVIEDVVFLFTFMPESMFILSFFDQIKTGFQIGYIPCASVHRVSWCFMWFCLWFMLRSCSATSATFGIRFLPWSPLWRPSTHSTHLIMYPWALTKASQSLWGVDDALAILLALGSEQLQVDGLSIALGNCKDLLICRQATWE